MKKIFKQLLYWLKKSSSRFYVLSIQPRQSDPSTRNRELVLNVLLTGTFAAFSLLLVQLIIGNLFFQIPLFSTIAALVMWVLAGVIFLIKRRSYLFAANSLTLLYLLFATLLLLKWGINLQFALLLYCLVIVLAGILLGSRYALYAAVLTIGTLFFVKTLNVLGLYTSDESWLRQPTSFGEVTGYSIILLVIGIASWLFGRENERAFARAQAAEEALLKEQAQLEAKIKARTLELQVAQFEEMQQLYRFAEVGQLSAALLHDLANHLAILTLDIEGLHQKQRSASLDRARRSILYLDDMVERVRQQLHDETEVKRFNLATKIGEVIRLLRSRAKETGVTIELDVSAQKRNYSYIGDSVKFNQIIAVVINNAIEAYQKTAKTAKPTVLVQLRQHKNIYKITIKDYGKGISSTERKQLFKPFLSTKKKGMGIGLFIARKMLEKYFQGTIELDPTTHFTKFIITIPVKSAGKP